MTPDPIGHNNFGADWPLGVAIISKNMFWCYGVFGLATKFKCLVML